MIIVLLCHAPTVSVLRVIQIFSTAVENNDDVGAGILTQATSLLLQPVEGFVLGCIVKDDLCRIIAHTTVASIIDDK